MSVLHLLSSWPNCGIYVSVLPIAAVTAVVVVYSWIIGAAIGIISVPSVLPYNVNDWGPDPSFRCSRVGLRPRR